MKRLFKDISFAVLAAVSVCSCSNKDDVAGMGGETGWLAVELQTDKTVVSRSGEVYELTILNASNDTVATYLDYTTITDRILLPTGNYKLIATQGEWSQSAWEKPMYMDSKDVVISSAETNNVTLTCTQANTTVTAEFSQKIADNFVNYSLTVSNGETDGNLVFSKTETRKGYFNVNAAGTLSWDLFLDNGQNQYHVTKVVTGVESRQWQKLYFDIADEDSESSTGAFLPSIVIDSSTNTVETKYDIMLKDTIVKPLMTGNGFQLSDVVNVLDIARGASITVDVAALGKISDLKIRHANQNLEDAGIPRNISLVDATSSLRSSLATSGVTYSASLSGETSAWINFSALFNRIPLGQYTIVISVLDQAFHLVNDTLNVNVIPDIDHIAEAANVYDVWAKYADISGKWYTATRPQGMTIEYSTDQSVWNDASADIVYNDSDKSMKLRLKNLTPSTVYYFRSKSDDYTSETIRSFTTESANQVKYLNFDSWYMDGSAPMCGVSGDDVWDSGNKGGASFGYTPTTEETSDVVSGSAARLATQYAVVKLAAGNIYTGHFVGLDGLDANLDFGIPYSGRPSSLHGYYKYTTGAIDRTKSPYTGLNGKNDTCHIYVALLDWTAPFRVSSKTLTFFDRSENNSSIIALGELQNGSSTGSYQEFDIKLKYRDKTKQPTYILIVASASKYGDYFTGSTSAVLLLDEFSLKFDEVE